MFIFSLFYMLSFFFFFFSSRRRHTRYWRDWSSDVCSSDLWNSSDRPLRGVPAGRRIPARPRGRARRERSEERRVGKEWRSRWAPYHYKKKGHERDDALCRLAKGYRMQEADQIQ